ncbi:hypothetical protein BDDG_13302, partial [Blastomyces dermatitidis ATCC 18188]
SSHIDRSASADNSELSVKSLIKNLKNVIMKKLFISCVTRSSAFLSASSAASFSTALSQSSTLISVSDSLTFSTSVPVTSTLTTSGFAISAFIISSSHFKEMLCRLNESHLSRIILLLNSVKIIKIVMSFTVYEVIAFTDIKKLFITVNLFSDIFASASEIILIKDDNAAETIFFCSQASSVTFSFSSAGKIVRISDYKYSVSDDF